MKHLKKYFLILVFCLSLCGCGTSSELGQNIQDVLQELPTEEITDAITDTITDTIVDLLQPTATPTPIGQQSQPSSSDNQNQEVTTDFSVLTEITLADIPKYTTEAFTVVNDNVPFFKVDTSFTTSFEIYPDLDDLGRCQIVYANVGTDIMPTEERGSISSVKPSGWVNAKYDCVDGSYLYNRCHLIGFQLTGENANKRNLITGTRYMNVDGMLPFENMIADYVKETKNHVMLRVYPMFEGDNLVADGVLMEAWSVEDEGEGICFNVFVYNIQPGVEIDYATGESWLAGEGSSNKEDKKDYVINTNTKKFHEPSCSSATSTTGNNRKEVTTTREDLINQGYEACGKCKP